MPRLSNSRRVEKHSTTDDVSNNEQCRAARTIGNIPSHDLNQNFLQVPLGFVHLDVSSKFTNKLVIADSEVCSQNPQDGRMATPGADKVAGSAATMRTTIRPNVPPGPPACHTSAPPIHVTPARAASQNSTHAFYHAAEIRTSYPCDSVERAHSSTRPQDCPPDPPQQPTYDTVQHLHDGLPGPSEMEHTCLRARRLLHKQTKVERFAPALRPPHPRDPVRHVN
ncbi:hypothetical protein BD779DRAFT_1479180 [Infundibulicybe gibba]|nr:hypothetical protein BD779DRAFT_1479180 [Infundibulicybe gibba]